MLKKLKRLSLFLVFSGALGFNHPSLAHNLDKIAAIVNDEVITQQELSKATQSLYARFVGSDVDPSQVDMSAFKKQVLDRLIYEKLQLQLAKQYGISAEDAEIKEAIEEMRARGLSKVQAQSKAFKEETKNELIISKLQQKEVSSGIGVSDTEIETLLKSPVVQSNQNTRYRIRHLLIAAPKAEAQKQMDVVLSELKKGVDFAKLATQYSNADTALVGGDLGFRTLGELPTLFVKHVPGMGLHQVKGPIESESGLHLIQLVSKQQEGAGVLNRQKASNMIYQRKMDEALQAWLRRLRDAAYVKIVS
ncbi:MAG: SurA N-terminal domain-containing protein [Gammaproteobacteria bacterium]